MFLNCGRIMHSRQFSLSWWACAFQKGNEKNTWKATDGEESLFIRRLLGVRFDRIWMHERP